VPLPTLILTVGLPRSGKTTWARAQGHPIVNPDAIRLALHGQRFEPLAEPFVWAIARVMVRSLFLAGHPVVLVDATNTTRKRRDEWQDPAWRREFMTLGLAADGCIRRARDAGDEAIVPVIERMAAAFEPVGADEREV
jgi:predicted kinase